MIEEWRDLCGYEDRYRVSNTGRVWSKTRNKCMGTRESKTGYIIVSLRQKNSPAKQVLLHRCVALTFIPNPEGKPQVNHKDGVKSNNCVENLEWCTSSENNRHAFSIGHRDSRGAKNAMSKLTEENVLWMRRMRDKVSRKEMARMFGISSKYATDIVTSKLWTHI